MSYSSGAQPTTGYNNGPDTIKSSTLTDDTVRGIRKAIDRVGNLLQESQQIADSILGNQPPSVGVGNKGELASSSRAHELRASLDELHAGLDMLEAQVQRFRAI